MKNWLSQQTYIALGVACTVAANERIETLPIEGFDRDTLNRILDLPTQNLSATFILPLGYKDENLDWLQNQPKVRKDLSDLIEVIK